MLHIDIVVTEQRVFEITHKMFSYFKQHSTDNQYPIFNTMNTDIDNITHTETTKDIQDGIYSLGTTIYYLITGYSEHNRISFQLDGYPKLKTKHWNIISLCINRDTTVLEQELESLVVELEPKPKPKPKLEGRDPDTFLDEAFGKLKIDWHSFGWTTVIFKNEGQTYINMHLSDYYTVRLGEHGLIDEESDDIIISTGEKINGQKDLKEFLKGRRVISLLVHGENWILKVIE